MTAPGRPARPVICELSDLPEESCGCRKHRPGISVVDAEPTRTAGHAYGPSIEAQYPGRCPACGERYEVGETIRGERFKTITGHTGKWLHAECVDE
jgi:hypothetical protein